MVDAIIEFIVEFFGEIVFEIATNKEAPLIFRILCGILVLAFVVGVNLMILIPAFSSKNGILITVSGLIAAGFDVVALWAIIKKAKKR